VSLDYFDGLYMAKDDPWDLATKWHDRRKYAVTAASLPREHYRRCYEPGASIGHLTRLLAARCDEVLATDAIESAVVQGKAVVADLANVVFEQATLPAEMPAGTFDLIVIGDLLYYLSAPESTATLDGLLERLEPGGDLVAVHFRDRENGSNFDGFNAHSAIAERPGLAHVVHHEDEWFVLDIWRP
jgi:trans-aconitate methyltransferase